jgi:hypothetical protein
MSSGTCRVAAERTDSVQFISAACGRGRNGTDGMPAMRSGPHDGSADFKKLLGSGKPEL